LNAKVFAGVKRSGFVYQDVSKVGVDPPVSIFVCLGQRGSADVSANAAMIKFRLHCSKAGFDVPQALTIGYLSKSHTKVLIETGESFYSTVAAVSADAVVELFFGKEVYQL
jgi:hypothetical protein